MEVTYSYIGVGRSNNYVETFTAGMSIQVILNVNIVGNKVYQVMVSNHS